MTTPPTLVDVMPAVVTVLDSIHPEVLNVYGSPPAAPQMPCLYPVPPALDPTQTFRRGLIRLEFDLVLLQSMAAGYDEAQESLWPYLDWSGDQSILLAFETNPTLGFGTFADGTTRVDAHLIDPYRPLGLEEIAALQAFGEVLPLTVLVTNKE